MSALGKCVWSHALFGLTFVSALASGGIAAAQPCQTDARSPEPPPTKAISLRRYEAALERCQAAKSCDTATLTLYGLTRVSGFVIDAQHHDVIIYGSDRPAAAPLYATDFAVALRNAERLYVKRDGGRLYYADPGVSIDPDPSVIHRLQALMAGSETSFAERDRRLEAWCSTCALPQRVRAEGVPVSHFLAVLFRADYLLKSVSNGKVPVTGMDSLSELAMRRAIASATAQPPEDAEIASLDRFWFHPGRTEYVESADSTELDRADVVLRCYAPMAGSGRVKVVTRWRRASLATSPGDCRNLRAPLRPMEISSAPWKGSSAGWRSRTCLSTALLCKRLATGLPSWSTAWRSRWLMSPSWCLGSRRCDAGTRQRRTAGSVHR